MSQAYSLPPSAPLHPSERDFSKGLKWSLILHVALGLVVLIKCLVFPGTPVFYAPTLRVDIVGLPDVLKKDLGKIAKTPGDNSLEEALKKAEAEAKKMKPIPVPKELEPASPDQMVLKPKTAGDAKAREKKLKNALARIKSLSKISADLEAKNGQIVKGNAISKGTSLSGDARESAAASYYDTLRERLQENWALPKWIARQNLSAQVQIFVDSRGRLRNFHFVKLSGNGQFDEAVKRAITESQPFPIPPSELGIILLTDGILVGFPL